MRRSKRYTLPVQRTEPNRSVDKVVRTLVGHPEALIAHADAWDARVLVRGRATASSRSAHLTLGPIQIEVATVLPSVTVIGAVRPGFVVFTLPLRASPAWRLQGEPFGPAEIQVLQAGREQVATTDGPVSFVSVVIPIGPFLERLDVLGCGWLWGRVHGTARLPPRIVDRLRHAVVAACGFVWQRSGRPTEAAQERVFVEAVFDAAAAAVGAWSSRRAARDVPSRRVEERIRGRLLQVLTDEPDAPLGIAELCTTAACSERALRRVFGRTFGTSPSRFLRLRRLDAARRALQAPLRGTTVTTVAMDFGFADIGRFAGTYRRSFGELPSTTLRRVLGLPPDGTAPDESA